MSRIKYRDLLGALKKYTHDCCRGLQPDDLDVPSLKDVHRQFFIDHGVPESLRERVMKIMSPILYDLDYYDNFELVRKQVLEAEGYGLRFANALATFTGREVKKIIFLSYDAPHGKPEWIEDAAYRWSILHFGKFREDEFYNSFLEMTCGASSLSPSLEKEIAQLLLYTSPEMSRTLTHKVVARTSHCCYECTYSKLNSPVDFILENFYETILSDDSETIERYFPIVELLKSGYPLWNLQHEPATWLVLCK